MIDALRRFALSFLQQRRVSAGQRATLEVLLGCRTAARGGYRYQCVGVDDQTVTIRTRGSDTVHLDGEEFVRRFAQHVLPKGFRRIRQYGLLAPGARPKLDQARAAVAGAPPAPPIPEPPPPEQAANVNAEPLDDPAVPQLCPVCGHLLHVYIVFSTPLARGPP